MEESGYAQDSQGVFRITIIRDTHELAYVLQQSSFFSGISLPVNGLSSSHGLAGSLRIKNAMLVFL